MKVENDHRLSFKKLQKISSRNDGFYEIPITRCWHFFMSNTGNRVHRVRESRIHMRYLEYSHTSVSLYCGNNGFPGPKGRLIEAPAPNEYELCPYCEIKAVAIGLPTTQDLLGYELKLAAIQPRKRFPASEPKQNTNTKIMNKKITITDVARICHDANRTYCLALGDASQPQWDVAPEWQRHSAIKGVIFHLENPLASASASHESWLEVKRAEGWTYGPVKDPEKKQHPCFVPFTGLPVEQQAKDMLFKHIVDSLRHIVNPIPVSDGAVESKTYEPPTLPRFQSHKVVEAAKIVEIILLPAGGHFLVPDFAPDTRITVSDAYMQKHKPEVGGYYVKYADGYESFSPAAAFESGYTPVN